MASQLEIQKEQRRQLFMLLKLEKDNKGVSIKGLDELIIGAKTEMDEKDVAWVEKNVAQLK